MIKYLFEPSNIILSVNLIITCSFSVPPSTVIGQFYVPSFNTVLLSSVELEIVLSIFVLLYKHLYYN